MLSTIALSNDSRTHRRDPAACGRAGHRPEADPTLFEPLGQPLVGVHCHILSSRGVIRVSDHWGWCDEGRRCGRSNERKAR